MKQHCLMTRMLKKLSTYKPGRQYAIAVLPFTLFIVLGAAEPMASFQEQPGSGKETPSLAVLAEQLGESQEIKTTVSAVSSIENTVIGDRKSKASVIRLNMAHLFPEGTDESDVWNSYAGRIYKKLIQKDSQWLSELYAYSLEKPENVARELGIPTTSILGKYRPSEDSHNPEDPSSFTIPKFEKTSYTFYDGNGTNISAYSNAKEILTMASIYGFYQAENQPLTMEYYGEDLWEKSHHADITVGKVYYCNGELDLDRDESEPDEQWVEDGGEVDAATVLADESGAGSTAGSGAGSTADSIASSPADSAANSAGNSTADSTANAGKDSSNIGITESGDDSGAGSNRDSDSSKPYASPSDAQQNERINRQLEGITGPGREVLAKALRESMGALPGSDDTADPKETGWTGEEKTSGNAAEECPGHVDLSVKVTIAGFEGSEGLYAVDSIGNQSLNETWKGWEEYNRAYVSFLYRADWTESYGLFPSDIAIINPLSSGEIARYLNQLPSGISQSRRDVVEFALSSVGRIPYYWGGKASGPGYEVNSFGIPVTPDYKGRHLKGLDCSGWINWVYWSATGTRPSAGSTGTLASYGRTVSKEDLQPGDIMVRASSTDASHVVMFLGWTEDGRMECIHESSTGTGNVIISTKEANGTSYRSLLN